MSSLIPDTFKGNRDEDEKYGFFSSVSRSDFNKAVRIISERMQKAKRTSREDILLISTVATVKYKGLEGAYGPPHVSVF